ncbi:MAG: site-specific DNA-methyltransferase [Deltaproteobacteria bacterium]|jgi:site-specific DNA-methyltransferase (adenine-specific)|nr:site-specific DNA-methyltransferase [Deltaproteobacteria bacterium]
MDIAIKIITGDCLNLMKNMDEGSIDLIVTDPPYNLAKDYGNNSDSREHQEYLEFSSAWLKEAARLLKPTGTIYVFMGMRYISYIYKILEVDLGFKFNSWITWHYTQGIGKTKGFSPRHDDILMFTKSERFTFNLDDIRIPQKTFRSVNNMRGANPGNVWEFSHVHYCQNNRQSHPTQKPEALFERMILASSNIGDTVLDPFCGAGGSLRVCQQTQRNGVGLEINPNYVELIKERLAQPFTGFDSLDERLTRVPNDLNDPKFRREYLKNHIEWFLKYHPDAIKKFQDSVNKKYLTNEQRYFDFNQ